MKSAALRRFGRRSRGVARNRQADRLGQRVRGLRLESLEDRRLLSAPFPLEETFLLHSSPLSSKVIYLDFDGHPTSGTIWNTEHTGGADFYSLAYSFEGDSSFSDAELEQIQNIWDRVLEDFIPFDVDVTTQEPGVEALRNTGGGDQNWGIRVVIGDTSGQVDDWYGIEEHGGVAKRTSFTWDSDTPCFVFADNQDIGNDEKITAEVISHEVGHTLGLRHDGTNTNPEDDYYTGHGSGATGWAPIMGYGGGKDLVQWSHGGYTDCNNHEDDLAIITDGRIGFGYRGDLHGDTLQSATPLGVAGGPDSVVAWGIIEQNSDADYFNTVETGMVYLDVAPFYRSPNLDILACVFDSNGNEIARSNPTDRLDAVFHLSLDAGTYCVMVEGGGKDWPTTPGWESTGYSDYGSLGHYTITISDFDTLWWVGGEGANGTNWHDPENWRGDVLPGVFGDDYPSPSRSHRPGRNRFHPRPGKNNCRRGEKWLSLYTQ